MYNNEGTHEGMEIACSIRLLVKRKAECPPVLFCPD